jgi:TusA-related sulfurtransferase
VGERPEPADRPLTPDAAEPASRLDIRADVCPYTFLKARLALEPLPPGALLRVVVGNEVSARDVPRSLTAAGHAVVSVEVPAPGLWEILVRKAAPRSGHA